MLIEFQIKCFLACNATDNVCKGIPILLYGLDACPLEKKTDLHSLDFVVNCRFGNKLFKANNKEIIKFCQEYFCFRLPSDLIETKKIDSKYNKTFELIVQVF